MRISDWSSDVCSSDLVKTRTSDRDFALAKYRSRWFGGVSGAFAKVYFQRRERTEKHNVRCPLQPFEIFRNQCNTKATERKDQRFLSSTLDRKSTRLNSSH